MEARLTSSNTTLILVTHDRAFMESVCTGILELDQGTAHLHSFGGPGSYDRFRQVCICAGPTTLSSNTDVVLKHQMLHLDVYFTCSTTSCGNEAANTTQTLSVAS